MKLKTKSKILLGVFVLSGMLSQVGNCAPFLGISETVMAAGGSSGRNMSVVCLYNLLAQATDDSARDEILNNYVNRSGRSILSPAVLRDEDGNTLLHLAARDNNVAVFDYLLGFFVEDRDVLKRQNAGGQTPLHIAVRNGSRGIVDLAVYKRAYDIDFGLRDTDGRTLLGVADETRRFLANDGTEIYNTLIRVFNVMRIVRLQGNVNSVCRFLLPSDKNMQVTVYRDGGSDSLLTYALTHESYTLARKLYNWGTDRDPLVWDGAVANFDLWNDAFSKCAMHGSARDLEFLLNENPFGKHFGRSFLDDAVIGEKTDNFKLLLENTHPESDDLDAAMSACVDQRNHACAEILVARGYDVNKISNIDGKTLLHNAADEQDMDKIAFLIEHGADPDIKDADGESAVDLLSSDEDKEEFERLCRDAKPVFKSPCKRSKRD